MFRQPIAVVAEGFAVFGEFYRLRYGVARGFAARDWGLIQDRELHFSKVIGSIVNVTFETPTNAL